MVREDSTQLSPWKRSQSESSLADSVASPKRGRRSCSCEGAWPREEGRPQGKEEPEAAAVAVGAEAAEGQRRTPSPPPPVAPVAASRGALQRALELVCEIQRHLADDQEFSDDDEEDYDDVDSAGEEDPLIPEFLLGAAAAADDDAGGSWAVRLGFDACRAEAMSFLERCGPLRPPPPTLRRLNARLDACRRTL